MICLSHQCLICLEDYNPEEDLRLLSCRHVFHKECVDRWLETGRNNCPACRSQVRSFYILQSVEVLTELFLFLKGVSTAPGPIPVPSSA
jgi:hypothetical protein